MRNTLVAVTVAVLVAMGAPAAPAHSDDEVQIQDGAFVPARLEVHAGDTVEWKNEGEQPHSVTSDDGSFDSGSLEPGDVFEVRFDDPGTYRYRSMGGADEDMAGVLVVAPADGDGSTGSDSDSDSDSDTGQGSGTLEDDGEEAAASSASGSGEDQTSGQADAAAEGSSADARASSGNVVLGQAAAVSIQDDVFVPRRVEVQAGGTVVWEHIGQRAHTVTASNGSFDSGTLETGASFSQTFSQPGTYSYYCRFHGTAGGAGMAGVVVVSGGTTGEEPPGETDGEAPGLAATGASLIVPFGVAAVLLGAGLLTLRRARGGASRK